MSLLGNQLRVTPDRTKQQFLTSLTYSGGSTMQDVDKKPFKRRIDAWFFALCLAVKKGLEPVAIEHSYNLEYASVLTDAQELFVCLIALEKEGHEIIVQPNRMLKIGNELANAGLIEMEATLNAAELDPIWVLSEKIQELLEGEE